MNTIAIDSNIYKGAESYAKLHNISVTAAIGNYSAPPTVMSNRLTVVLQQELH